MPKVTPLGRKLLVRDIGVVDPTGETLVSQPDDVVLDHEPWIVGEVRGVGLGCPEEAWLLNKHVVYAMLAGVPFSAETRMRVIHLDEAAAVVDPSRIRLIE